jgi:hypothetical protein
MAVNKNRSSLDKAVFKVGVDNIIFSVDLNLQRLLVLLVRRDSDPYRDLSLIHI